MPRFKRKGEMKRVFERVGIAAARGRVCPDADTTRALVANLGYPVVAKPDRGMGATGTFKIDDARELEAYLSAVSPPDYIVEEFIEGDIVSYDGLTDRDGRVVFDASLRYSRGVMEVVNEDTEVWYYAVREIPRDLEQAGRALVEAFDVRERFFHFEFFRQASGRLVALEVNERPPGGPTVDMWNYQRDIDMFRAWGDLLVTGRIEVPATRPTFCAFVGRKHRYPYAHGIDEILERFGGHLCHHQPIEDVFSAAMGNYAFILRSPDLADIERAAEFIQRRA
jgi:biotin carboxylase